ncbi:hypothetical protein KIL84_004918 [Mauremys mutica]|uniref:Ig-like domain-containing protein n=1 Tax=Mauremys mutica TaxID=74926 RepID=A0A9D3XPZ8_9SAUR|nr:hypothetical protein KIL84_004918 [Mauremys mutica]
MGVGRILGAGSRWAGALLVTLTVLRTHLAHCTEPEGRFVFQQNCECHFANGTERVRYLERHIWGQQQILHFDSDVGVYEADTELGRPTAESWNKDQAYLADRRAQVDTVCRHNYGVAQTGKVVGRTVEPKVKVSPTKSGSEPHSHLLVCSVTGFYPGGIEIKWLKNGQEQTAGVVSTELLQNGDWTFQILVMLEMSPRRGDWVEVGCADCSISWNSFAAVFLTLQRSPWPLALPRPAPVTGADGILARRPLALPRPAPVTGADGSPARRPLALTRPALVTGQTGARPGGPWL